MWRVLGFFLSCRFLPLPFCSPLCSKVRPGRRFVPGPEATLIPGAAAALPTPVKPRQTHTNLNLSFLPPKTPTPGVQPGRRRGEAPPDPTGEQTHPAAPAARGPTGRPLPKINLKKKKRKSDLCGSEPVEISRAEPPPSRTALGQGEGRSNSARNYPPETPRRASGAGFIPPCKDLSVTPTGWGNSTPGRGKPPPSKSISSPLKMRGGVEPKGAAGGGEGERAGLCPGEGPGASLRNKSEGMWSSAVTLSDPPAKITAEL